jgi:predicted MPP superfamily phosphohydrolase
MMMRFLRLLLGSAALSLMLGGCSREAESVPPPAEEAAAATGAPWEHVSADSIYGATPVENLTTTPVELDLLDIPPGWEGMRVAAISDFELGLWSESEEVALAATRRAAQLNPDLIVLLGDYLARGSDTTSLERVLIPLRGKNVLAVLGDRDIRSDSLGAAITRTLARQGIRVLKNGSVPIVHNQDTAFVAGVDPKLADAPSGDQEWILSQLGAGRRGLLLVHEPVVAAAAPKNRFPGVLAGGTFCGRVDVPGTTRLAVLNTRIASAALPGVSRLFRFDRTVMFVTCGVGYSFVPVRFGAPPEVALITLHVSGLRPATPADSTQADSLATDSLLQRYSRQDTTNRDSAPR